MDDVEVVFYRFKAMSKEEAERAKDEWQNLKKDNLDQLLQYLKQF